jgi:hypothetical protein
MTIKKLRFNKNKQVIIKNYYGNNWKNQRIDRISIK